MNRRDFLKVGGMATLSLIGKGCIANDTYLSHLSKIFGKDFSIDGKKLAIAPYQIGLCSGYEFEKVVLAYATLENSKGENNKLKFSSNIKVKKVDEIIYNNLTLHFLNISNLNPGKQYHYEIQNTPIKGLVRTSPIKLDKFNFVFVSDTQNEYSNNYLNQVKSDLAKLISKENPNFLINGGDVTENSKVTEYLYNFFPSYTKLLLNTPLYVTKGNHDIRNDGFDNFFGYKVGVPGMPIVNTLATNYSFDYSHVHFTILDSNNNLKSARQFLEGDLKMSNGLFNIVVMHHPFRIPTTDLPVDAVFAGHLHTYRRFKDKNNIPYVICGGGGGKLYDEDKDFWIYNGKPLNEVLKLHEHHYISLDVKLNKIDVNMINKNGILRDKFSIRG
jgi:predicted phosphodiesterase